MLYDINHGLGVKDYQILCEELKSYYGEEKYITHYGGEFFAATKENTVKFVKKLEEIYEEMIKLRIFTTKGDEFITSICAHSMKNIIKNASPYIYRFWTGSDFRLISTSYKYNKINILHVPSEKNDGMIKLYDRYISKGIIPKEEIVWNILHLTRPSFIGLSKKYIKKLLFKKN